MLQAIKTNIQHCFELSTGFSVFTREEIEYSIHQALIGVHQDAMNAAKRAHDTATSSESVAENKYDTFGLEASYLAHGQSVRVAQCQTDITAFEQLFTLLKHRALNESDSDIPLQIALGHLVELVDEQDIVSLLFMGPNAGGLKIDFAKCNFMLITPQSPIGEKLMSREVGDEVSINVAGKRHHYEIVGIY